MTFQGDPYRTLGLAPGASVNEIRSAYRRMAKRYHPDAAGERALPRFLAIQAAYEALVDANGDLRAGASGSAARPPDPAARPGSRSEPWRADTSRARASRDAWRTRNRPGTAAGGSESASGRPGDAPGATPGGPERRPPGAQAEHGFRRHRRTATPGSTTYDEAAETPLDPAWDGGTWYGASSGTYWTLNPREYADPRKHGPEYRRRAWRAAGQRSTPVMAGAPEAAAPSGGPHAVPPAEEASPFAPGAAPDERPAAHDADADPARAAVPPARHVLGAVLPERLLVRASQDRLARAAVSGAATVPVPWLAGLALAGIGGCSAGGCPPLVGVLALVAWGVAGLAIATLPAAGALGAFAALVAIAGSLVSGLAVALASGEVAGSVAQAAGTLGVVLYCIALVVGGARLHAYREPGPPAS